MKMKHPSPLFVGIVNDYRYALRKMGSPQIWHNFREENAAAHILATEGRERSTTNEMKFLIEPPPWVEDCLSKDSLGGYVTRKKNILF